MLSPDQKTQILLLSDRFARAASKSRSELQKASRTGSTQAQAKRGREEARKRLEQYLDQA